MGSGPCAFGILLSAILLQHGSMARFDANLTLKSSFGQLRQRARSLVLCWSEQHSPARIVFERPGGLPRGSQRMLQGSEAHSLILPGTAGLSRTGLFSCRLDAGGIPTTVDTLKLPPSTSAQVEPLQAYVVAHSGDTVQLSVTKRVHLDEKLVWRLEGEELSDFEGSETVTLVNVEPADGGVYECHYRGERDAKLHAWIRLAVAGCPRGKFGPTCRQDCPPCRNGGVCHDVYGDCICPAGFAGPHCDTRELPSVWPQVVADINAQATLKGKGYDGWERCALHVFCKPDPMSCSCAPGFRGAQCNQECDRGFYGADCLQRCHCAMAGDCDSITGRCPQGGCAQGWTGESCHIEEGNPADGNAPTSTKALPTQKPDCPPGWFGKNCSRQCHCEDGDACDASSGHCPGSCQPGYSRPTCSECLAGKFGDNCSLTCHCWNGHQNCMPDGRCHDGCAAGWTGEHCQEGCSSDTFGPDCAYECHCSEASGRCDPVSGICSACEPGYQGLSCQDKCKAGTYGENCSESCSCLHGETCDHINGSCQCMGRHRGRYCDELVPEVQPAEELELDQGHQGSLLCLIEANPAPHIELSNQVFFFLSQEQRCFAFSVVRDEQPRFMHGRARRENRRNVSNVKVQELGAGLYKATAPSGKGLETGSHKFLCTATNEHGSDVGTLHVTVLAALPNEDVQQLDCGRSVAGRAPGPVQHLNVAWVNSTEALVVWEAPSGGRAFRHLEYRVALVARDLGGCGVRGTERVSVTRDLKVRDQRQLPLREDALNIRLPDCILAARLKAGDPKVQCTKLISLGDTELVREMSTGLEQCISEILEGMNVEEKYMRDGTGEALCGYQEISRVAAAEGAEPNMGRVSAQFHMNGLVPHSLYEVRVSAGSGQAYGKKSDVSFLTDAALYVIEAGRNAYAHYKKKRQKAIVEFLCHIFCLNGSLVTPHDSTRPVHSHLCAVPSLLKLLAVAAVNQTNARLLWKPPEQPNGKLTAYEALTWRAPSRASCVHLLCHYFFPVLSRTEYLPELTLYHRRLLFQVTVSTRDVNMAEDNDSLVQALVVDPDIEELLLSNLVAGRSYTASVRATTGVGPGPSTKVHFSTPTQGFTKVTLSHRLCRRQYRLDVVSGDACPSSRTSTTTDEHKLTKHPSQTNSEDGLFVDWSQPNRTFQSTYM
ncbi:hypothetical protein HPB48_007741 [Haemaphysalis longicornis]|uniref:Uncharacterized protein n=1 Tax=Haemaphysalis longicornis TaxID=44386 RepID=A0A9J6FUC7_HAELO|nr:hypothetical protein HPB48_007741 [Haemaphysalis longicornis]